MAVELVGKCAFFVECFGDNGSWFDIVIADDEKVAINKCELIYSEFHKKFKAYVRYSFDSYIE